MSDPPMIQNTHPVLARNESLSWAEREDTNALLLEAREAFVTALSAAELDNISWEETTRSGIPLLTITTPSPLSEQPSLLHLMRQHGGEMHAIRPVESSQGETILEFDAIIPPQFAVGAISEVLQSSSAPVSERVTVTGALRRAGIAVGDSVRMSARPKEVRLWPAESKSPVCRAGRPLPTAIEQPPTERMVKNVVRNLQDGAISVNIIEQSARPRIRVQTTSSRLPPLHHALSNTPAELLDAEYNPSSYEGETAGLTLTVGIQHSFSEVEDGHGQKTTAVRKKTKRSCMVTLTRALSAAGIVTPDEPRDANPRVAVFARPGELRVVPATQKQDPVGLNEKHSS